jgi:succinate dehydrogenase assembly factor 2
MIRRSAIAFANRRLLSSASHTASDPQSFTRIPIPKRVERPNETEQEMRRRLLYQSRKRGILEADLLLSTFFDKYKDQLTATQLRTYDRLLDENDWDLYYWSAGERPVPQELADNEVLRMLQAHFRNEGKLILRMPELKTSPPTGNKNQ